MNGKESAAGENLKTCSIYISKYTLVLENCMSCLSTKFVAEVLEAR